MRCRLLSDEESSARSFQWLILVLECFHDFMILPKLCDFFCIEFYRDEPCRSSKKSREGCICGPSGHSSMSILVVSWRRNQSLQEDIRGFIPLEPSPSTPRPVRLRATLQAPGPYEHHRGTMVWVRVVSLPAWPINLRILNCELWPRYHASLQLCPRCSPVSAAWSGQTGRTNPQPRGRNAADSSFWLVRQCACRK